MIKIAMGLLLGLVIGAGCRWFDLPLPSPPRLVGVFLILTITVGYIGTDKLIAAKFAARGPATAKSMCAGPTGEVISKSQTQETN